MASLKDYTRLLGLFYSYFGALELVIAKHILPENLQDIHERRKADLISQDLIRLGAPVPDLLLPGFLPAVKNYYEAFGALYVIEGSSLGGNHIAKMIRRKLPEVSDATLFFQVMETGQMKCGTGLKIDWIIYLVMKRHSKVYNPEPGILF